MSFSERLWGAYDQILAGWRAVATQLPVIAEDPRAYPRESMLIAAVIALAFMLLILSFFAIADSVNAAAARRRLGYDPRRVRRMHLLRVTVLVLLVGVFLASFAPFFPAGSKPCGSCHSIKKAVDQWDAGLHANVGCWGCHSQGGVFGALEATARELTRVVGRVPPQSGTVPSSACLGCHDELADAVLEVNNLRVSHKEMIDAKMDCLQCHGAVGHSGAVEEKNALAAARGRVPIQGSRMSKCLLCHNGRQTSSDCEVCHKQAPLDTAMASSADGRNVLFPDCDGCHSKDTTENCTDCHGLEMPHPLGIFVRQHAGLSNKNPGLCAKCHDGAHAYESCGCHDDTNIHGTYSEWFPIHGSSAIAVNYGAGCRCHSQPFCGRCHDNVVLSPGL